MVHQPVRKAMDQRAVVPNERELDGRSVAEAVARRESVER